jgi:hypothetical protein
VLWDWNRAALPCVNTKCFNSPLRPRGAFRRLPVPVPNQVAYAAALAEEKEEEEEEEEDGRIRPIWMKCPRILSVCAWGRRRVVVAGCVGAGSQQQAAWLWRWSGIITHRARLTHPHTSTPPRGTNMTGNKQQQEQQEQQPQQAAAS